MENYEDFIKRVINRLKKIRKSQKLTQTELSRKIGKNDKYINSIESGTESISLKTLIDITNELNITIEEFLGSCDYNDINARVNALSERDQKMVFDLIERLEE